MSSDLKEACSDAGVMGLAALDMIDAHRPEMSRAASSIRFEAKRLRAEGPRSQGKQVIVKARGIKERLMLDTWELPRYALLAKLRRLRIPTLVITGEHDFFPVEVAGHIAEVTRMRSW